MRFSAILLNSRCAVCIIQKPRVIAREKAACAAIFYTGVLGGFLERRFDLLDLYVGVSSGRIPARQIHAKSCRPPGGI